jgi:hypothetical protein
MVSLINQIPSSKAPISKFRSRLIRAHWVVVTRGGLRHSIPVLIRRRVAPRVNMNKRGCHD